ncbi:MAG: hypothetical protein EPN91_01315 [Salinibacterium sp.]|nr:MAG: hypothetical protein EPN91_01315 [Salinibacterium sp.]
MKYAVKVPIEAKQGEPAKTRWHTVGRAFDDRDGSGRIVIILDSIPFRSEYMYLYPEDGGPPKKDT